MPGTGQGTPLRRSGTWSEMSVRSFVISSTLVSACAWLLVAAQSEGAQAQVEAVRVVNDTVVHERITAGADPVVVPTCGAMENQEMELCILGVDIEVESTQGWIPAPLNPNIGCIPGGYPLEQGPVKTIEPGTAADFTFSFSRVAYILRPKQQVRLRIHYWPTEESMRKHGAKRDLITSPFAVY